ncbi:hypothetical protein L6452_20600 [Arctium lappa]|uniref:Uncharacterized protein n=1 Tax=Arctium lappa TaxID=4217 RepID=A0ACB9BC97_ARCLA|nr:hypothetical protein L6452_20600 [Arctium lappa]
MSSAEDVFGRIGLQPKSSSFSDSVYTRIFVANSRVFFWVLLAVHLNQESYCEVWVRVGGVSAIKGRGTGAAGIIRIREEEEVKEMIEAIIIIGTMMNWLLIGYYAQMGLLGV